MTCRENWLRIIQCAFFCALSWVGMSGWVLAAATMQTEKHLIRITPVVTGLEIPWGLAFLPDGRWLVTEREGRLRVIENGGVLSEPVAGVPEVRSLFQGGLFDVLPHPRFAENRLIYLSLAAGSLMSLGTEVVRGKLIGTAGSYRLTDVQVIFRQDPKVSGGRHFGGRLLWDREGKLVITLGDRGEQDQAQQLSGHLGKIVRLNDDGAIPDSNPFRSLSGARPEILSIGHRNVQGAALHPRTRALWTHEHGPQGGDEVNLVEPGRNYGWPVITYGVNYVIGTKIGEGPEKAGMEQPLWKWVPSIAPSGMSFYSGRRFPGWQGSLFLGALKAMVLIRLTLDGERIVAEERIAGVGRVRDVREGPDGFLYVLSETEGAILRIEPAQKEASR